MDLLAAASDYDRWLTRSGRRTVESVGEAIATQDLRYTCIYTSPLVRAVQTAEILAANHPGFDGPLVVHRALSNEHGTAAQALEPLELAEEGDLVVMVTHMPKVSMLAGHLGRLARPPTFATGAACLLNVEGRKGRVLWMLDPQTLEITRF